MALSQTTTTQKAQLGPPGAAAAAAPGGSIPETPKPEELPLASSHTTTMQTAEITSEGEMITVVTTKTTIITKAPGVKRCMESEASSSGVKR